jgi:RND family efflux transporter MFP subunit
VHWLPKPWRPCVIFALMAALAGCGAHGKAAPQEEEEESKKGEAHVTVRAASARVGPLTETVEGLGRCEALPDQIATLTPAVEGHVHELVVALGDAVKKGDPIVELDKVVAQADLAEKTATSDGLKASLALLKSLPRKEERRPNELAVAQAKVAVERARAIVESLESLRSNSLTSKQQLFDAQKALELAQFQEQAAEATLRGMMIGPRAEAITEALGRIKTADALVALSRARLEFHTIRAPIDGTLDSLTCHPGQTVAIGTPIGEVVDTRRVFASVWLPSRSAGLVRVGQPARVVPADARRAATEESGTKADEEGMTGKVAFVGRVADPQTGNLPCRLLVANPQGRLTIGQSVRVSIVVGEQKEALQVPVAAVLDLGEGPVLSVVRDGKAVVLHPTVREAHDGWVSVAGTDLKAGEPVIVEGGYNLPKDTPVQLAEETKAAAAEVEK